MSNYRYTRMAHNELGWTRPHGGRMGGDDYLGQEGIGHEDWNFAKDVWKDGRYHLYLKGMPAGFDGTLFNFVLGAHASPLPVIIGFIEKATFGRSELPDEVVQRRAQELSLLDQDNSLGPRYGGKSVEQIAKLLKVEAGDYQVSVAPEDLHVLVQPVPVPSDIYKVTYLGFRALPMSEHQYNALKEWAFRHDTHAPVDQEEEASFPEGLLVERVHKSRERSRTVIEQAKRQFISKHGRLFCEACDFDPEEYFGRKKLRNRIIEAHHDLWLSDPQHQGETRPSDLKMVCPTCHRAIHTIRPWLKVEQLRELLGTDKQLEQQ